MKKNVHDDSQSMKRIFELSIKEIENVLDRKKPITDVTKIASNTVSSYSRIKSTEIHEKALEIMISKKVEPQKMIME